jgi:hypothetical protein
MFLQEINLKKNNMKNLIFIIFIFSISITDIFSQDAGSVLPNPADVTDTVELSINLSSPGCGCPGLLGQYAPSADDPLYLWTWTPQADDRQDGDPFINGEWELSNDSLIMTQSAANPSIWSYKMIPTDFYNVSPSSVYINGFSFLAKKKNGKEIEGEDFEAKSADQIVPIESVGCVDKFCPYPTNYTDLDYFSVIYNRAKETNNQFRNGDANTMYLFPKFSLVGAETTFLTIPNVTYGTLSSFPELKMNSIGNEKFESNIVSLRNLFGLQPGQEIYEIQWRLANTTVSVPYNFCPGQVDYPGCE